MYICCDCGEVVERFDCGTHRAYVGEYLGISVYRDSACCPECGSTCLQDAVKCEECGGWCLEEDLSNGFCKKCLDSVSVKDCFDVAKKFDEKKDIKINSFIAEMFTVEEMEDVLLEALKNCDADASKYVNVDREWFSEKLKELKGVRK